MPRFPGGMTEMVKYMQINMNIPYDVREGSRSEKAFVKFVVDTSGNILDPIVVKHSGYKSFDAESVNLISKMPTWIPGSDKGRKVKVSMILPISYRDLGVVEAPPATE